MLGLLVALVVTGPVEPGCSIEGAVRLQQGGKALSPAGRVVVFVDTAKPRLPPPPERRPHQIRQVGRQFEPRLKVVVVNDTVEFVNEDKDEHSVFSNSDTDTFDFPASRKGKTGVRPFLNAGPVMIQCDRHGWMRTDVLVVKNPFYAVLDATGRFKLEGLPPGTYGLVAWERNDGRATVEVKGCRTATDVGTITLDANPDRPLLRRDSTDYPWELKNPY